MSYVSKDGTKWEGVVPDEKKEYFQCEKCGSKKIRMVAHWDGCDAYGYVYNCENGHEIRSAVKRRKGEMWL